MAFIRSIWCVCCEWFDMLCCTCFSSLLFIVVSQKTATAVAHCKRGNGLIKVNGRPLEMVEPATLQYKVRPHVTGGQHQGLMEIQPHLLSILTDYIHLIVRLDLFSFMSHDGLYVLTILHLLTQLLEPVLLLGKERFAGVDIRVRVKGGGHVAQIYGNHNSILSVSNL